jgi:hypothetical protein
VPNPKRRKHLITSRTSKADPTNSFERSSLLKAKASMRPPSPKILLLTTIGIKRKGF